MKRSSILLSVLFLTFVLGLLSTILWIKYNPEIVSYDEAISSGIPTVEYCELRNDPYKYNGKVVRLTADLNWFMHGYFLLDAKCSDDFGYKSRTDEARTAILFYKENWTEIFEYLQKFHAPNTIWKPVKITAIGRFKYENPKGYSDGIEDRTSFHFEIYKIESAAR